MPHVKEAFFTVFIGGPAIPVDEAEAEGCFAAKILDRRPDRGAASVKIADFGPALLNDIPFSFKPDF